MSRGWVDPTASSFVRRVVRSTLIQVMTMRLGFYVLKLGLALLATMPIAQALNPSVTLREGHD